MAPEQPAAEAMVPIWAVTLTGQVAEIKAKTDSIPAIQRELEAMRAGSVPLRDHQDLEVRVNALWDAHNARVGELQARGRTENFWRFGLTTAYALLALWVTIHQAGITIHP